MDPRLIGSLQLVVRAAESMTKEIRRHVELNEYDVLRRTPAVDRTSTQSQRLEKLQKKLWP